MNDGMLSQEEIDALLNLEADEGDGIISDTKDTNEFLSKIEEDTLGEIGNISFGSSATTLSTLLNQKVSITTPEVTVSERRNIHKNIDYPYLIIEVNYIEGFSGQNILVMKTEDAAVISDIMLGGDGTTPISELSDIHLSAVQETMNQMMGTAATSMSTVFGKRIDISPPTIEQHVSDNDQNPEAMSDDTIFVKVSFQLQVGDLIDSSIMQLIPLPFARQLAEQLLQPEPEEEVALAGVAEPVGASKGDVAFDKKHQASHAKAQEMSNDNQTQFLGDAVDTKHASVEKAMFSEFPKTELTTHEHRNLDMLLDIPLKVTVELGRTKRSIKDILELSAGSIIELDKLAGEPVDVLVNEKPVAKGEVVVIDENFGVRITDILSQSERLYKLNKK